MGISEMIVLVGIQIILITILFFGLVSAGIAIATGDILMFVTLSIVGWAGLIGYLEV